MHGNWAWDLLRANAGRHPGKAACLCGDVVLDYAGLQREAHHVAGLLRGKGVAPGQRVMIALPDGPAFAIAFLGSLLAGACAVPVDPGVAGGDLAFLLDDSEATACVAVSGHPALQAGAAGIVVACDAQGPLERTATAEVEPWPQRGDDIVLMLYSSGSTGRPKGIPHCAAALPVYQDLWGGPLLGVTASDIVLCSSKLFFAFGLGVGLLMPLAAGATTILNPQRPVPADLYRLIARHRPTVFASVPTVYGSLLRAFDGSQALGSLRLCLSAGEALPELYYDQWRRMTGVDILDALGATETLSVFLSNRPGRSLAGSCGEAIPGFEARIVDDDGSDLPDGEVGTLLVRGVSVCRGYWRRPQATQQAMLAGGWLRTGDMVERRAGRYFHRGRSDDMMKVGGQWVSPLPVEEALRSHPQVADCAVVTRPIGGTAAIHAFVVVQPGTAPSPPLGLALRRHTLERLPPYMCPARITFLDELPRTVTGKVQRFKLREAA